MLKYSKITVCYESFYPSELIYFSHFKMRHPVLHCTTGQLVGHLSGLSMSPINYPLINGCHYQSVYLCEHYCFIYCNYRQEKYLHYNFKTPTPAQTRNAGTSAGIFEHNPHFGFEIPSLKPISTHNVLCTTLKVFQKRILIIFHIDLAALD